jgi:hypothetical protein
MFLSGLSPGGADARTNESIIQAVTNNAIVRNENAFFI